MNDTLVFSLLALLFNHHTDLVPNIFHLPVSTKQLLPIPCFSQPVATTILLSISMDFPVLAISCKLNHA